MRILFLILLMATSALADSIFTGMQGGTIAGGTVTVNNGGLTNSGGNYFQTNTGNGSFALIGTNGHFKFFDTFGQLISIYTNGFFSVLQTNGNEVLFTNGSAVINGTGQFKGNGAGLTNLSVTPTNRILTLNGTAKQITVDTSAQNLAANRTWNFSTPQNIDTNASMILSNLTLQNNLTTVGDVTVGGGLYAANGGQLGGDGTIYIYSSIFGTALTPQIDNSYDIGSGGARWKDIYSGGTAHLGTITGNGSGITNLPNANNVNFQPSAPALTNLVGTVARNVTNITSLSTSNATSKPLTNSYGAGGLNLFGLEAGANTTLTPNGSNIVIASTASGGGISTNADQFAANPTLNIKSGVLLTNGQNDGVLVLTATNLPGMSNVSSLHISNSTTVTLSQGSNQQYAAGILLSAPVVQTGANGGNVARPEMEILMIPTINASNTPAASTFVVQSRSGTNGPATTNMTLTSKGALFVGQGAVTAPTTDTNGMIVLSGGDTTGVGNSFELMARTALTTLPVPYFRPRNANTPIAFDLIPKGSFGDSGDNGIAWIDICSADIIASSPAFVTARIGVRPTAGVIEFGERVYSGGTALPVALTAGGVTNIMLAVNGNITVANGSLFVSGNVVATNNISAFGVGNLIATNAALHKTIAPANLHNIAIGKGWTNDLGARADIIIELSQSDAATGDPGLAFTNSATGEAWTNSISGGLVQTRQQLIYVLDVSTNDYGSFNDISSGTGSAQSFKQAWWKLK